MDLPDGLDRYTVMPTLSQLAEDIKHYGNLQLLPRYNPFGLLYVLEDQLTYVLNVKAALHTLIGMVVERGAPNAFVMQDALLPTEFYRWQSQLQVGLQVGCTRRILLAFAPLSCAAEIAVAFHQSSEAQKRQHREFSGIKDYSEMTIVQWRRFLRFRYLVCRGVRQRLTMRALRMTTDKAFASLPLWDLNTDGLPMPD